MSDVEIIQGDCRKVMATMPAGSVDAVITDPPYPEISREYGRMTEAEWHDMMRVVVAETRRVLKPRGSAVFVLQPNSEKVGRMRPWLWEFMAWACREWNMVQDAWWWNINALPVAGCGDKGLMRPSLKACVWLGPPDCYRDQESALWKESQGAAAARLAGRFGRSSRPSGWRGDVKPRDTNHATMRAAAARRGGVTPFNVLPCGKDQSGHGHGAATPMALCDWWVRYLTAPGDIVLDPFAGSGTVPVAAFQRDRRAIAIEQSPGYVAVILRRVAEARTPLFDGAAT